jgi:3-oxoacyl-[acyl-carrier-protein] synthase-3
MESKITALGTYVPDRVIDNHYWEQHVETTDEWIESRTGIKERRFAAEGQLSSDLAVQASLDLAARSGKSLEDVDFIIVATTTPDQTMPSTASQVQTKLGIQGAGGIDTFAACAGFGYGLVLAQGLIAAGTHRKILVIGVECLSRVTNEKDRTTCILFGDGAGAALVEPSEDGKHFLASITGVEGDKGPDLYLTYDNTQILDSEAVNDNYIHQNGRAVFKWAVGQVSVYAQQLLEKAGMQADDIDWFIPHSANLRIIEAMCRNIGIPQEKALESIVQYGNTSSASIPLALQLGLDAGKVKKGDKLMLLGFGGGLSYAGVIVEW